MQLEVSGSEQGKGGHRARMRNEYCILMSMNMQIWYSSRFIVFYSDISTHLYSSPSLHARHQLIPQKTSQDKLHFVPHLCHFSLLKYYCCTSYSLELPSSFLQYSNRLVHLLCLDEYIIRQEGRRDKDWNGSLFKRSCEFIEYSDLLRHACTWHYVGLISGVLIARQPAPTHHGQIQRSNNLQSFPLCRLFEQAQLHNLHSV